MLRILVIAADALANPASGRADQIVLFVMVGATHRTDRASWQIQQRAYAHVRLDTQQKEKSASSPRPFSGAKNLDALANPGGGESSLRTILQYGPLRMSLRMALSLHITALLGTNF